jgi:Gamma interferon inducible lysosomal thiol reductase (GILT)
MLPSTSAKIAHSSYNYPDPWAVCSFNASDQVFGVSCDTGFTECAADVQQLCVHKYASFNAWWQFVMCQNYQGLDRIGDADVATMCARSALINWDESGVGECIGSDGGGTGKEGVELLQQNVQATDTAHIE